MQPTKLDLDSPLWGKRQDSAFIQIRISRKTLIASIVSLLVHLLALYIVSHWPKPAPTPDNSNQPFEVSLAAPAPPQAREVAPPESQKLFKPPAPRLPPKQVQKTQPPPMSMPMPAPAANPISIPEQPAPPKPAVTAPPAPVTPPTQSGDLASYIKAKRAQRGEPDDSATVEEKQNTATAPIPSGVNGIFQINNMEGRYATFTFRGWKNELSYTHRETYQVEVGASGDLRLEVIRKMIEIIRRYYTGDFNWNSRRLQQVVVLSARPRDTAELEEFMMKEFF